VPDGRTALPTRRSVSGLRSPLNTSEPQSAGSVTAMRVLGGLHHDCRAALRHVMLHELSEQQSQDVGHFARPTRLEPSSRRTCARPVGETRRGSSPGARPAAGPALFRGQSFALEGQATSLLGVEVDPRPAGCRRKGLFENANFFSQIIDPPRHPIVDRVRNHRNEKLEGRPAASGRTQIARTHRPASSLCLPPNCAKIAQRWFSGRYGFCRGRGISS
jgi:hypothetical protein